MTTPLWKQIIDSCLVLPAFKVPLSAELISNMLEAVASWSEHNVVVAGATAYELITSSHDLKGHMTSKLVQHTDEITLMGKPIYKDPNFGHRLYAVALDDTDKLLRIVGCII